MTPEKIKRMLDACYLAKRTRDLLPPLPDGVTPSFIRFLDTIHKLQQKQTLIKISDISDALGIPRPGVTRTVKDMENAGYLCKTVSDDDARITYITITPKGEALSEKYDRQYYNQLCPLLEDITEEEADIMIQTIEKFYRIMNERRVTIE